MKMDTYQHPGVTFHGTVGQIADQIASLYGTEIDTKVNYRRKSCPVGSFWCDNVYDVYLLLSPTMLDCQATAEYYEDAKRVQIVAELM